jgi:hypothetical protein
MESTNKSQDIEPGVVLDGYPALAAWMARDPDYETLVFRRFSRLSARNLLHLQSQLISLEVKLDEYDRDMLQSKDMDLRLAGRRWETLVENAKGLSRQEEMKRLELYEEIQTKIRQYRVYSDTIKIEGTRS